jgi:hypothetical protein
MLDHLLWFSVRRVSKRWLIRSREGCPRVLLLLAVGKSTIVKMSLADPVHGGDDLLQQGDMHGALAFQ